MEAYNINATISIKLLSASLDNLNFANAFNETFTGISFVLWNHFYLYYRCLFYNLRLYIGWALFSWYLEWITDYDFWCYVKLCYAVGSKYVALNYF